MTEAPASSPPPQPSEDAPRRRASLLFAAGATLDPGPEPFHEGDKSFDVPPKNSRGYYREPPLLKGLSVLGFGGKVTRAQVQERVGAVVALVRAARRRVEVVQPAAYEAAWELILRETKDAPWRR